jgi:LysR family glycine cleavage system transcriptional activator
MTCRLPPLDDLHAFALVAETVSLTRAAARLNVSQPAISKRIQSLEARLGVALVDRRANRIVLTEAGARYASALAEGFSLLQGATEALLRPPAGSLRVRAYTTWALRWLIPRLPNYYRLQSDHSVEVTTSLLPVDFASDPVDVAVRMGAASSPVPGATRLHRHTVSPFASPAVAATLAGRFEEATLLLSLARPRDWISWGAATGTALPSRTVAFESTSLAIQAAIEGIGLVIAAPMLVEEDVREGRLVSLAGPAVATEDYYWLLLPPGRVRPEAVMFTGWLLHEMSLQAASGPSP